LARPQVRGTLSASGPRRPASARRLAQTLGHMGVDIVVIAEHTLSGFTEETLKETLSLTTPALLCHGPVWRRWWSPSVGIRGTEQPVPMIWTFRPDHAYGTDVLDARGPFGVWVDVGPKRLVIHPNPRWGAFVSDPAVRDAVTSFCESVAVAFDSEQLLYLPDSAYGASRALDMLEDDCSLSQILTFLQINFGPPIYPVGSKEDGYFVANVA
jgi:hypothetical protein